MLISDWSSDVCSSDLEQQCVPHIRKYVSAKFRHLIDVRTERHPSFRTSCLNQGEARLMDWSPEHRPGLYRFWLPSLLAGAEPFSGGEPGLEGFSPVEDSGAKLEIVRRSEEHTSELQSLMRISYAVFCLKKKKKYNITQNGQTNTKTTSN